MEALKRSLATITITTMKMQVKIFRSSNWKQNMVKELERDINLFLDQEKIKPNNLVDIKFTTEGKYDSDHSHAQMSAMVIYNK